MSDDPFELQRFIDAQEGSYASALAELRAGQKRSHWMWFVFPQHVGLGRSIMAARYGLRSIGEARAYFAHPLLSARLRECVAALADLPHAEPVAIFGEMDAMKLRSCLTLFEAAGGGEAFAHMLDRCYGGERDPATLALL